MLNTEMQEQIGEKWGNARGAASVPLVSYNIQNK